MSRGFERRLDRLEVRLVIGEEARDLDLRKRRCYNLRNVSDAALVASMRTILGEIEEPEWVRKEFELPIPADAPSHLLREAEVRVTDVGASSGPRRSPAEWKREMMEFYREFLKREFKSLSEVQAYFEERRESLWQLKPGLTESREY